MTQHPEFDGDRRFAFDLAKELGLYKVNEMLYEMSALEFEEWKAYFRVISWEQEEAAKKAKRGR